MFERIVNLCPQTHRSPHRLSEVPEGPQPLVGRSKVPPPHSHAQVAPGVPKQGTPWDTLWLLWPSHKPERLRSKVPPGRLGGEVTERIIMLAKQA